MQSRRLYRDFYGKKTMVVIQMLKDLFKLLNTVTLSHKNVWGMIWMLFSCRNGQHIPTRKDKVHWGWERELLQMNTVGKDRLTTFLLSGCAERSLFHTTGIGNTVQEARTAACRTAELQLHWCEAFRQEASSKTLPCSLIWKRGQKKRQKKNAAASFAGCVYL